jgi:hypothetical protein
MTPVRRLGHGLAPRQRRRIVGRHGAEERAVQPSSSEGGGGGTELGVGACQGCDGGHCQ